MKVGLLEILLAVIARPGDAVCIHLDAKADVKVFLAVTSLVKCYGKVRRLSDESFFCVTSHP